MTDRLYAMLEPRPPGFSPRAPRRRDLLAGANVVLVEDAFELEALLGDAFDRFRGIVVTLGPAIELRQESPLRFELSYPESDLPRLAEFVEPLLALIRESSLAADRAAELEFVALRAQRELETTKADYVRITRRLEEQIRSLTETESMLRTSERAVRRWSQRLEERVDERTAELVASNAALLQAMRAAEQADAAKGAFLATLSHEIRTPLGGILGVLELLAASSLESGQRRLLDSAKKSGSALLGIVDSVLDAAKLGAGKVELEQVPFDVLGLVESVAETLSANAIRKGIELHAFVDPAIPTTVIGDPTRVRQVLQNLVANAVKFTSSDDRAIGRVMVSAHLGHVDGEFATLVFTVTDTGIGIDTAALERLFVPFAQAEASTTRRFGGTGLGLSICKDLVELMHGRITVTSEPGRGSRFEVVLPFALDRAEATREGVDVSDFDVELAMPEGPLRDAMLAYSRAAGATVRVVDDPAEIDIRPQYERHLAIVVPWTRSLGLLERLAELATREPLTSRPGVVLVVDRIDRVDPLPDDCVAFAAPPISRERFGDAIRIAAGLASDEPVFGRRDEFTDRDSTPIPGPDEPVVLVVEDDDTNREVLVQQLRRLGVPCLAVRNGAEALRVHAERQVALVLTDCHMPELDGFELARRLREIEARTIGSTRIPILALTASTVRSEADACFAAGMDGCFRKPMELEALRHVIATWLPHLRNFEPAEPRSVDDGRATDFDPDALHRAVGGSSTAHPKIIRMYLESAGNCIRMLDKALGARDRAALAFEAHKLRSSSLTVGAIGVGTLCESIERNAANEPEWTRLAELVVAAEKEFVRVTPRLVEWSVRPG